MNEYRIIFEYKGQEKTKVLDAANEHDAEKLFFSKIKSGAKQEVKIKDIRRVEPITQEYNFNSETVATFLQWYLEQADAGEYDFTCTMAGKKADEIITNNLQAMNDFVKGHFLTNIKIVITGDKK